MTGSPFLALLQSGQYVAFVLLAVALLASLVLHELAHAVVAYWQGDRLPKAQGRITLNPARHLDPLGTLLLFVAGFGWAKPVQFRLGALRSKRFGAALVALAGPLTNLALALVAGFVYAALAGALGLPTLASGALGEGVVDAQVNLFFRFFVAINVILAVFNLIPLPPLDGSRLLTIFLPPDKQGILFFLDRYGFLILIALLLLVGTTVLGPIIGGVLDVVLMITRA